MEAEDATRAGSGSRSARKKSPSLRQSLRLVNDLGDLVGRQVLQEVVGEVLLAGLSDDRAGATYRAVYSVRFRDAAYVLHAFRKKVMRSRVTPQRDMDLVRRRFAEPGQLSAERLGRSGGRE